MKEVTYYIADDGKRFEDEDECYIYENGLNFKKFKDTLQMWDCNFERTEDLAEAYFIKVTSIKAAKWLAQYALNEGITSPFDNEIGACVGCWCYCSEVRYGTWIPWDDISKFYHDVHAACGVV